jgi:hypothetical protein
MVPKEHLRAEGPFDHLDDLLLLKAAADPMALLGRQGKAAADVVHRRRNLSLVFQNTNGGYHQMALFV